MALSRGELAFIAAGAVLGTALGLAVDSGWVAASGTFPPFVFLLLGLGLVELAAGFATGRPPGALVRMPARVAAFALGLGILVLLTGKLA